MSNGRDTAAAPHSLDFCSVTQRDVRGVSCTICRKLRGSAEPLIVALGGGLRAVPVSGDQPVQMVDPATVDLVPEGAPQPSGL